MKVAICGDGFRVHGRRDNVDYTNNSVRVLERLITPALKLAGCEIDAFVGFYSDSRLRAAIKHTVGESRDVETWILRSQVRSAAVDEFYHIAFDEYDLIVGFEMSSTLISFCAEQRKKVIDFAIHPYRFLADLLLMARSPDPDIDHLLNSIFYPLSDVPLFVPFSKERVARAEAIKATIQPALEEGVGGIYLMQTRFDRSKFDGRGSFVDDLAVIRSMDVSPMFYKPHPSEPRPEIELELRKRGAARIPPNWNFYDLVVAVPEAEYIAVSSGTLAEAEALGASRTTMLAGTPWTVRGLEKFSAASASDPHYIPVDMRFASASFWKAVLEDGKYSSVAVGLRPDVLRTAWGERWDYQRS